jgi:hypothetical protein
MVPDFFEFAPFSPSYTSIPHLAIHSSKMRREEREAAAV